MLALDAGNALFKLTTVEADPRGKERALFLLGQMDALGITAMAVGARDLSLGADFLLQTAKGRKMKLLSANLVDAKGKPLFPASTVVSVGGLKFGLVGVSPEGPLPTQAGVVGQPPVRAALTEARRLREKDKVDVVVVLAAIPYLEASTLSEQSPGVIDFVLQSSTGQGSNVPPRNGSAGLISGGDRGRQVVRVALSVDGPGPFVDLTEADRAAQNLKIVDSNLQQSRQSLALAKDPELRRTWEQNIANFESRRQTLLQQMEGSKGALKRTQAYSVINLGPDVASDPEVKKQVERIDPLGSASH